MCARGKKRRGGLQRRVKKPTPFLILEERNAVGGEGRKLTEFTDKGP